MNAEDVTRYLLDHPEYFEEHAHILADVVLPHPHGGRTISIGERQAIVMREKIKLLESKLAELIQFGEENDAISEKVHRITLALLMARSLESLLHSIQFNLREDFAVPHVAMRLWKDGAAHPELAEFSPVSAEWHALAESLTHPHCGVHPMLVSADWFGEEGGRSRSYAIIALRAETAFGLVVLASEDPQRFYPEMGTLYLKRLGELISSALGRYLGAG